MKRKVLMFALAFILAVTFCIVTDYMQYRYSVKVYALESN